jgi:carbohydrate-binding DOMON domain-containing protein
MPPKKKDKHVVQITNFLKRPTPAPVEDRPLLVEALAVAEETLKELTKNRQRGGQPKYASRTTHIEKNIHTYIHTQTYTHTHTQTHTQTHTHTHGHTHSHRDNTTQHTQVHPRTSSTSRKCSDEAPVEIDWQHTRSSDCNS